MEKKLLIIAEKEFLKDQVTLALYQNCFSIDLAKNHQTALQIINTKTPDLILLDTELEATNSSTVYKSIRNNVKSKNIPVIFLTDLKNNTTQKKLSLLLSEDYITKPISTHNLHLRIQKTLNLSSAKIMLIGHSGEELKTITKKLSSEGFHVITKEDIKNNINYIQEQEPKLIIVNTEPFSEKELHLTTKIQYKNKQKAPIIFLTLPAETNKLTASNLLNNNDYLLKPYLTADLILRIKKQIAKIHIPVKQTIKADHAVTNLSEVQETLLQKEKKDFLEQLNVTLNHEIRNPLTSILIGSQALISRTVKGSDEFQVIKEIEKSSLRIKEIIDSLGNLKQFVVDDYINNIKMINLAESAKS
jgi:DNA-binding response OmpR family regulator